MLGLPKRWWTTVMVYAIPTIVVLVIVDGLVNVPSESLPEAELTQAIASVLTAFAYVLIIAIYREQLDLRRAEQRPVVNTEGFRGSDTDELVVQLKNYGRGSATSFDARVVVRTVEVVTVDRFCDRIRLWLARLCRKRSITRPRVRPAAPDSGTDSHDDEKWQTNDTTRLAPDESDEYHVTMALDTNLNVVPNTLSQTWKTVRRTLAPGRSNNTRGFISAMEDLDERADRSRSDESGAEDGGWSARVDPPRYRLSVVVEYDDAYGESYEQTVLDCVVPVGSDLNARQVLEDRVDYEEFDNKRQRYVQEFTADGSE